MLGIFTLKIPCYSFQYPFFHWNEYWNEYWNESWNRERLLKCGDKNTYSNGSFRTKIEESSQPNVRVA